MLRLPLIVLMLTPGIAHAQKFISTADALQPGEVQVIQTMQSAQGTESSANAQGTESSANGIVDPIATASSTSNSSTVAADGSIYLSETFFSEGSIENGTNVSVQALTTIEAADVVWIDDGNFEAATLALGECNAGSTWNAAQTECEIVGGN